MKASRSNGYGMDLKFLNYAQSNQVKTDFVVQIIPLLLDFSGEKSTRLFSELCCCHFCNALNSLKSSSLQYVKSETKSSNDDKVKLYRVIKFKLIPQKAHLKVL